MDCNFSFDLWAISARRCGLTPNRSWSDTITQLKSLPMDRSSRPHRLLVLLAWQSTIYWVWNERNARLHSNTYRSIDSLFKTIDLQIRNRTQSFRVTNPRLSSQLLQSWIRLAWFKSGPDLPSEISASPQLFLRLLEEKDKLSFGLLQLWFW